jgi:predicted O-methyltransferase YrrM
MPSDRETGCLLRALCASKPGGNFLEIGTGTGLSACWMLDGMDEESRLLSIDNDPQVVAVAQKHLGDPRLTLQVGEGLTLIQSLEPSSYDLIFADAMPGKYERFDLTVQLLRIGGLCVLDDMLPQSNWPDSHPARVDELVASIARNHALQAVSLDWSTGIIICTKVAF